MLRFKIKTLCLVALLVAVCIAGTLYYLPVSRTSHDKTSITDNIPKSPDLSCIKVGDLVFRMGTVIDSRIIANLSHSKYSHVGVVVETEPQIMVIQATTSDYEDCPDQVVLSPITEFWSKEMAQAGAAYSFDFMTDQEIKTFVFQLRKHLGEKFIFDGKDQPHLYCSTLIFDELIKLHPEFNPKWRDLSIPGVAGEYLFPQAIIDTAGLTKKIEFQYSSSDFK